MPKSAFSLVYERFRQMLIQARKEAGLTQRELADRLGRPQSYVSKYENAERRLDLIEFIQIAEALGIDAASLVQLLQHEMSREKK